MDQYTATAGSYQGRYPARPGTAPAYRSRLAGIFGPGMESQAPRATSPRATSPRDRFHASTGFNPNGNGMTMLSPRSAMTGMPYGMKPRPPSASPRAQLVPRGGTPMGSYVSTVPSLDVGGSPQVTHEAAMHAVMQQSMRQERASFRQAVYDNAFEGADRIHFSQKRDKLKSYMRTLANGKDECPVDQLLLAAQLAELPMDEAQQRLLFQSPIANRYASTWNPNSARSTYGLECEPARVKRGAFVGQLQHQTLKPYKVEEHLNRYAQREADEIAMTRAKEAADKEAARLKAVKENKPPEENVYKALTDEQLRLVHKTVKARLSQHFDGVRAAFQALDKDGGGTISPQECVDAMMKLNVGVPRKFLEHLVNVADYDRDGEINYKEFQRILTCDDITAIGFESGDVGKEDPKNSMWYRPGITKAEMRAAQRKLKEMLHERGGLQKMFRIIDEDKSGQCSRKEIQRAILMLNLDTIIRVEVLEELIGLMDADKGDSISYAEFAHILNAEDPLAMEKLNVPPPARVEEKPEARKLSKKDRMLQRKIERMTR